MDNTTSPTQPVAAPVVTPTPTPAMPIASAPVAPSGSGMPMWAKGLIALLIVVICVELVYIYMVRDTLMVFSFY